MFCNQCGNPNPDNANNCVNCGAPLNNQQPPQQPPQQPNFQQQPSFQQPNFQQQQQQTYYAPMPPVNTPVPGKGLGVASMVLGILALVLDFCLLYFTLPLSIAGIALGGVAMSKAKAVGRSNGMAVAGVVCSVIALVLVILLVVLAAIGIGMMEDMIEEIDDLYYMINSLIK